MDNLWVWLRDCWLWLIACYGVWQATWDAQLATITWVGWLVFGLSLLWPVTATVLVAGLWLREKGKDHDYLGGLWTINTTIYVVTAIIGLMPLPQYFAPFWSIHLAVLMVAGIAVHLSVVILVLVRAERKEEGEARRSPAIAIVSGFGGAFTIYLFTLAFWVGWVTYLQLLLSGGHLP